MVVLAVVEFCSIPALRQRFYVGDRKSWLGPCAQLSLLLRFYLILDIFAGLKHLRLHLRRCSAPQLREIIILAERQPQIGISPIGRLGKGPDRLIDRSPSTARKLSKRYASNPLALQLPI
jgi:hypothetical protein